ncbi:integrator complex subunit 1 [Marchantia polymorpha subsp. ruderalis]|uniref:DUF3677 domain-containing protein n=2 Tax=Marchantia polymorpha TaxID=3197 RepID=A0AAF6BIB7_MARPO|nr:hypothetical protein MARPO_0032s0133 [Marchantia polymorpha]PTQ41969.1 hypothetical protein MARPO_0032s0133 [Marchantia polymorpha]BBN11750.1 hypothetical protein Mp_5g14400 [Marchantia polymorpha subsp. ruderalis]BBN11751.1 hypothetical protein Mp_5g14400 [Marchantia polymorpha subsp. ruderalis]|eukprot:PTQ41968.1 hypothetical protein MARPO_0032s0133 [Marchantia polymorpha]
MKRHLPSDATQDSDELRAKSRRIYESRAREDEEEPGGFLDLNATPRGFDLNAPVEEESPRGQSGWLPANEEDDGAWLPIQEEIEEGKDNTEESKLSLAEIIAPSQVPVKTEEQEPAVKPEKSDSPLQSDEPEDSYHEREAEDAREIVKDSDDEPELKPLVIPSTKASGPASAVIQRSVDSVSVLGIDDDLDILRSIWNSHQQNDVESMDNVLVEACEELAKNPFSPSRYHYLSCLYISKKLPEAFSLPKTLKVLLGMLKSPNGIQSAAKRQIMLPVLACKLLNRAFAYEAQWPLKFVQIYLEDATGSRSWIEHEGCKEFVANILTAFPDADAESSASPEDLTSTRLQDSQGGSGEMAQGQAVKSEPSVQGTMPYKSRYPLEEIRAQVRTEFLQALNQLLGSASTKDNPRQLLKLLMQGAGYEEVRVVASSMLETYLNNTVHLRAAKALLDRIVQHTRGTSDNDCQTVANLLALRITSMQAPGQIKSLHGNIFGDMVTQLVRRRPEYATLALKTFVTAEVNNKNPHNLKSIVMALKAMPESPPPEHELASIFQELAANEEYRFQLRDLIRRMMKQVGSDLDVHALCHGLMQPWPVMAEQHEALKEVWLKQLVDLACQLLLHAVLPYAMDENVVSAIYSTPTSSVPGPGVGSLKEKLLQLEKFSLESANFQIEAMAWCTDILAVYLPSMEEAQFTRIVRQLLFMETSEVYYSTSDNVSETDLVSLRLLSMCMPAPEEILARLILMAISNFPLSQGEALKIIERLVWRAAALKRHFDGALTAASVQLPAAIFKLASFNLPGQSPIQQLVVKDMYWRACIVVVIIGVYNASTIGWFVWENLPTIRNFMEALLTCTRTFLPNGDDQVRMSEARKLELEAEQRDSKAEEAISAFLDVTAEKRRSDPSSAEINSSGSLMSSPGARLSNQGGEWRGKVMFLEQTGPVRRPPKCAVDELDRVDDMYQLGHILRKSRDPDFFSEITKSQTLAQSWAWLQKILIAEPDVITYLPPVWQCELLFMHEGQHPLTRKLFLDIGKLRSHLHLVMVQQLQSKEIEVERVVNFLSRKLFSKSGAVRSRARRCFESLFYLPSSSTPDFTHSVPSSPQDLKRSDPTGSATIMTGSGQTKGVVISSNDNVPGAAKKVTGLTNAPLGQASSSSLSGLPVVMQKVSPGVSYVAVNEDTAAEKGMSSMPYQYADDDCGWLEVVEKLPTASRVVSVLAPSIQRAIQEETSIHVVTAYLEFLKNHLSGTSLAYTIATLVVRRKMLATSLILGSSSNFIPAKFAGESGPISRSATVDLVLGTLCKALESGTVTDLTWDELRFIRSPIVTLVTPQVAAHAKELTSRQVKVHQIVVDAALEVLSLLGQHETEEKRKSGTFQKLLTALFPACDTDGQQWGWDLEVPIGWLEDTIGKQPLLSEAQAVGLIRTNDLMLIKAGLSVLTVEAKLELFEGFGLSSFGIAAVLQDLNSTKDVRLQSILGSGSFSRDRLKRLTSSVRAFWKVNKKGCDNLQRILEQMSATSTVGYAHMQQTTSFAHMKEKATLTESSDMEMSLAKPSLEENTRFVFEWLTSVEKDVQIGWQNSTKLSAFVELRHDLQRKLVEGSLEILKNVMGIVFDLLEKANGGCLADQKFLTYGLPILVLLSHAPCSHGISQPLLATCKKGQPSVECLTDLGLERRNVSFPGIATAASVLLKDLQMKLVEIYEILARKFVRNSRTVPRGLVLAPSRMRAYSNRNALTDRLSCVTDGVSMPFDVVERASSDRFEAVLRYYLCQKLQSVWEAVDEYYSRSLLDLRRKNGKQEKVSPVNYCAPLSKMIGGLLCSLRSHNGVYSSSLLASSRISPPTDMKAQIEFSGRCGLVMEMLSFLDPEFDADGFLAAIVDISGLQSVSKAPYGPSLPAIGLSYVVHNSSWDTLSKVFKQLVNSGVGTEDDEYFGNASACSMESGQIFRGMEPVIEFIFLCVQHPRAKLACRACEEVEPHKSSSNLHWSWLSTSSARTITKHSVAACVASKLANMGAEARAICSDVSVEQYVRVLETRTLCPVSCTLKVLALAVCQGPHIMRAVVQHLCSYDDGSPSGLAPSMVENASSQSIESTYKAVARSLLWGLYLIFPVSIKSVLHSISKKGMLIEDIRGQAEIYNNHGQTCSLNSVIHSAVWSFCSGNDKESNAAYGFCTEFARQHPLLLIPFLPTLKILLKELLPLLKQGETQARMTVTRALSMGLGLLDALRPHVILKSNSLHNTSASFPRVSGWSDQNRTQSSSTLNKSDLEDVLNLYFEILRDLEVQDRPHFAKVVARFADFLCHCVAAGGRSREYVSSYRTPVLETTAQSFGKIKKIGYLLSLLDKPGSFSIAEETAAAYSLSAGGNSQASTLPIPLDQILTVRKKLQQCIKLYTKDSWNEEGLAFYSTGKSNCVSQLMVGDGEEGSLSATLTDVDKASARVPGILSYLEDSLVQLITIKDATLRERIYGLLERRLLHGPSETSASNIVEGLLQQLTSSDVLRAKSAARNTARFFQFSTDLQESLLVEMLQLGRIASDDLQRLLQGLFTVAGSHSG